MYLPHQKNQIFTLVMIHSIRMWPFQTTQLQLLDEIFPNILFLDAN
jgi:hypothetical protein